MNVDASVDFERVPGLRSKTWYVITPVIVLVVFLIELATPRGFSAGLLYAAAILAASFSLDRRLIAATSVAAIALTILGYFVAAPSTNAPYAVFNRTAAVFLLAIVGFLAAVVVRYFQTISQSRDEAVRVSQELSRAQDLLRVGGRVARLGGWTVNATDRVVEWSDEVAAIHELPPGEYPKVEDAIRYYAPAARERIIQVFEACLRDGTPYDEEFEFLPPSGQRKWVRSIAEPVRDADGHIVKAEGALQDITELKTLRENLEASEANFRRLADSMPLVVWTAEADGTVDYSNQALYEYTGQPHLDLPAEGWVQVLHRDDVPRVVAAWEEAVRTQRKYRVEFRIRRGSDGAYRWHSVGAVPIRNDEGVVVKWYGTATDIHDHKENEEELSRLSRRLVSTLESITDGFYIVDREWNLAYINAEFARWLGTDKEEVLGKVMWDAWPHLVGTAIHTEFQWAVANQKSVDFIQYFTLVKKWVRVHAYPSDDGLTAYLEDITAQRELDERQRQSQRLEAIGQLTGGVAHDFNNLLTVILGNAEALVDGLDGDEDLKVSAELTMQAAERGAELTSRLLSFARKQPLVPKPTDINDLVFSLERLLRRTLGEDIGMKFVLRSKSLWRAAVDTSQFENALLNLCINARDAMPEGGRITIETDNVVLDENYANRQDELVPGQYVMLAVSDTGVGMAPDVVRKAFEPFFTTKAVGQGSGLGLSMVYGFIKQSRGHVKIYSEVGHGTTIKLYLPKAKDDAEDSSEVQDTDGLPQTGSEHILLVEDDAMVREHVAAQLKVLGYQVTTADDGHAAMDILREGTSFDLLFTDVVMPGGMGGRQLAEQARQLRPDLRVLFTSGYTENSIVHNGRLDAGVDLLNKPYRRQDLATKLRLVLDRNVE